MMYKTHANFARVSAAVSVGCFWQLGLLPEPWMVVPAMIMGIPTAKRGAAVPDGDISTSKAAQEGIEHKIISLIWGISGVAHRGKASHTVLNYLVGDAIMSFAVISLSINYVDKQLAFALLMTMLYIIIASSSSKFLNAMSKVGGALRGKKGKQVIKPVAATTLVYGGAAVVGTCCYLFSAAMDPSAAEGLFKLALILILFNIQMYFIGIISHLISDMFTKTGVFLFPWSKKRFSVSPFKIEVIDPLFYAMTVVALPVAIVWVIYISGVII